jgi:DNA primase (bacterial type)
MSKILVGNQLLEVDLVNELEPYFESIPFTKWTDEKLVSISPFREDRHPSFFVNLSGDFVGTWGDSGSSNDEWKSGSFAKLLSFFREESVEETIQYLREKYEIKPYEKRPLNLDLTIKERFIPLVFDGGDFAYDYLESRGISREVIEASSVADCGDKVAFLWYNPRNELVAIKYRFKDKKMFYCQTGSQPLKEQLYNIQRVYNKQKLGETVEAIWITEGETDALTVESANPNYVGVAIGGAYFSPQLRDLILRTGVKKIVIATDNDTQGLKIHSHIKSLLQDNVKLFSVNFLGEKDVNDYFLSYQKIPEITEHANTNIFTH